MYTLPQITQPEDSDFREHKRTVEGAGLSARDLTHCSMGLNILGIFSVNTQRILVTLYSLDNVGCSFRIRSLLPGFTQKEEKGPNKEILCLFYIPEDRLAGFHSAVPAILSFRFHKIMAVIKTATMCLQLAR